MNAGTTNRSPRPSTTNFLLGSVAALLALNLIVNLTGIKFPPEAQAQTQTRGNGGESITEPPFNAGAQRKQMIDQLTALSAKLASLEAKIDKGISVKVTEMPPVNIVKRDKE